MLHRLVGRATTVPPLAQGEDRRVSITATIRKNVRSNQESRGGQHRWADDLAVHDALLTGAELIPFQPKIQP